MAVYFIFFRKNLRRIIVAGLFVFTISSCVTSVKNYRPNYPFVYKTNINVTGNFSNEERKNLASRLKGQLDDSLKVRSVSKLFFSQIKNPPLFDSGNIQKSVTFMRALLTSLGYFKDTINYATSVDTVRQDQFRTTILFNVKPGNPIRLDSFSYAINHPELQAITLAGKNESLLKKGDPFAKLNISLELDRLVELYRNKGFMRFTREGLFGLWDTLDVSLLKPTLNPFEQLEILQKIKEKKKNQTANLEIRLRPGLDSNKLRKYFIGNINVYPDYTLDTLAVPATAELAGGINIISYKNLFKHKIIPPNIFLKHGEVYDERNYAKTIDRFNLLGSWRLITLDRIPRKNQDTADFILKLTPAKKYSFTANLEGSLNQSIISGNLFGIALNLGLQNRNFAKVANQASTNLRFGIETGRDTTTGVKFIQTRQVSIGHTIYFPRLVPKSNILPEKIRSNIRTALSFNAALTERRELYNLNSINGSWGYELRWGKKIFFVKIPNIEYSSFSAKPKLEAILNNNPALRNVFTDGFISSIMGGMNVTGGKNSHINNFHLNIEESGLLTGLIKTKFLDSNLYRFIKIDAEFGRKMVFKKTALVVRVFAGVGYEFNSTVNPVKRNNLPFFKEYLAGGPNSMRAWGLRKLGPGSLIKDFGNTGIPERYGDLQLEGNIEYRFPVISISGIKINGALFTDFGNIWYLKKEAGAPEEVFNINRLGKDLAIGVGAGLRLDFSYFLIRLDYSYKAKDPSPATADAQNKFFYGARLLNGQFQLGIGYPFNL